MSEIELIGNKNQGEPGKARVICTHCNKEMQADLSQYMVDMTKPVKSRCPYCNGELFTVMVILTHKSLQQLSLTLQHIINAVESQSPLIGQGNKTKLI